MLKIYFTALFSLNLVSAILGLNDKTTASLELSLNNKMFTVNQLLGMTGFDGVSGCEYKHVRR